MYPVASCGTECPDAGCELKSAVNAFDIKINVDKDLWNLAVDNFSVFNKKNKLKLGCTL